MPTRRRVVITGLGPITAFGMGMDALWDAMLAGRSAIARIRSFDPGGFPCQIAAELSAEAFNVRDVVPRSYRKNTKVMCRDVDLAVGAAAAAVANAKLATKGTDPEAKPSIPPHRFGCQIGAGLIAADVDELTAALVTSLRDDGEFDLGHWGRLGMQNLTPLWLLKYLPNMLACHVTIVHDCQGPSNTITCCEASAALSLGESLRVIDRDGADACLTGGVESKLNPMAYIRLDFAGRLAPARNGVDPTAVVKPFDSEANGTVMGEGGGLLVVEAAEIAQQRGAHVYAEIAGFAATQSFCPDTIGLELDADDPSISDAIETALSNAGIAPEAIDAVVPFGSGIPSADRAEAAAIQRVFGARAAEIPIVTTIPFVGNCAAGNSAVSLCVGAKCLEAQKLPARLNTTRAEGLNACAATARDADLHSALVMTTSQGGQNAAIVLRRP